ncbi:MAG: VapC ribonuclease [Chthonomonas sp.]
MDPTESSLVIDSSAIIASVYLEPGYESIAECIQRADKILVPACVVVEASMVASRLEGAPGAESVAQFVEAMGFVVVSIDHACARLAVEAFLEYGKGRHPAKLNFGDCMVYAVAKMRRLPILCTGDDFAQTGIATLPQAR